MTFVKGDKVRVMTGKGYVNEGQTGVIASDQDEHSLWADVKWDDSVPNAVDGYYVAASLEVVVEETQELTAAALAALVDAAREEGKAEGKVVSDEDKAALKADFEELNRVSERVVNRLRNLDVL